MAGNPNCLVYNMYKVTMTCIETGEKDFFNNSTLGNALDLVRLGKACDRGFKHRHYTYAIKYEPYGERMAVKDLLEYLDARLRDAKQRYDYSEREIHLGEINAINYIIKYLTDLTYRRIANDYFNVGGDNVK